MKWALIISFILLTAAALLIGTHLPAYSAPKPPVIVASAPQPPTIVSLLTAINAQRAKIGVAPLQEDARLDASAQQKADDMWKYNYFAHVSPHDGKHGYEYINTTGIYCKTDSENLSWRTAKDQITTDDAVYWWMHSTPHREALLNPAYTLTGFGIVKDAVVEHFCQQ